MKKNTKKSARPRGRPAKNQDLTCAFQVRCTPAQKAAYEAEAERLGFRRGPHDTGIGLLARLAMDRVVADSKTIMSALDRLGLGGAKDPT